MSQAPFWPIWLNMTWLQWNTKIFILQVQEWGVKIKIILKANFQRPNIFFPFQIYSDKRLAWFIPFQVECSIISLEKR